jgi:hypothetical protein
VAFERYFEAAFGRAFADKCLGQAHCDPVLSSAHALRGACAGFHMRVEARKASADSRSMHESYVVALSTGVNHRLETLVLGYTAARELGDDYENLSIEERRTGRERGRQSIARALDCGRLRCSFSRLSDEPRGVRELKIRAIEARSLRVFF